MVRTISNANSWNLAKMKWVKVLKNHGIAWIVINTSWTPTHEFTHWLMPSSNSLVLNRAYCFFLSCLQTYLVSYYHHLRITNYNYFLIKLKLWLEDKTIFSKQENHKWKMKKKKWMGGVLIYIIPTHKTKVMSSKQKLWFTLSHKVENNFFELCIWFWV